MIWPRLKRPTTPARTVITWDPGARTGVACWFDGLLQAAIVLDWERVPDFCRNLPRGAHVIEKPDHVRTVSTDVLINLDRAWQIREACGGAEFAPVKQWKGTAPKHVTEAWAREALSPAELANAQGPSGKISHHGWDAIALGLWYHKRLITNQG